MIHGGAAGLGSSYLFWGSEMPVEICSSSDQLQQLYKQQKKKQIQAVYAIIPWFNSISLSANYQRHLKIICRKERVINVLLPSVLTSVSSSPSYVLGSKFVTASLPLHLIAALS